MLDFRAFQGTARLDSVQHFTLLWMRDVTELAMIGYESVEAVKEDVLAVFVSALLKKMMEAWMRQA